MFGTSAVSNLPTELQMNQKHKEWKDKGTKQTIKNGIQMKIIYMDVILN